MDFFDMGATFDQDAFLLAPIKSAALWQSQLSGAVGDQVVLHASGATSFPHNVTTDNFVQGSTIVVGNGNDIALGIAHAWYRLMQNDRLSVPN
jgi:hypothetical protein